MAGLFEGIAPPNVKYHADHCTSKRLGFLLTT